jgi:hypothetical protein
MAVRFGSADEEEPMTAQRGFGRVGSVLLAAVALAAVAKAGVIVVDPGGGDGTAQLTTALNDALDGDIVLVRAGIYTYSTSPYLYTIDGKGLTLTTDAAAPPTLGALQIRNVPAGSTVTVRGLTLGMSVVPVEGGPSSPGVYAHDDPGNVWIEDCTLNGANGSDLFLLGNLAGQPGLRTESAPSVTVQRCTVNGGRGANFKMFGLIKLYSTSGGAGLDSDLGSSISMHECTLLGGQGGNGPTFPGTDFGSGGDGAGVHGNSTLHLAGCSLTGASNGTNTNEFDEAGSGVNFEFGTVFQRDSTFTPGVLVPTGVAGVPAWPSMIYVHSEPAPARSLVVSSPLQEGAPGTIAVDGEPGDAVTLLIALHSGWTLLQSKQGVLELNPLPALLLLPLGTTDAGGNLSLPFITPNLPPSTLGVTIPMQMLVSSGDGLTLEASSALIWLDSSL